MLWQVSRTNKHLDATEEPVVHIVVEIDNHDLAKLYENNECHIDMGNYGKLSVSVIKDTQISLITPTEIQLSGAMFYNLLANTEINLTDKDHEPTIDAKVVVKLRGQRI